MPRLAGTALAASAIIAAAALAVSSQPAAAQTTTLTMSSWVSPSHLLTKDVLAVWGQQVEKATDGRVKLQMLPKHPSAAPGTLDAVRDGLVDVSYVTASYTPARHTMPLLAELPGGGATSVINSVAYSRIHWKYLQPVGEYKGVKLLGVFTHGPGQMFNTKRPINKVEDLAGMKIRTGGGICRGNGAGARRFGVRQAGARVLRAAQLRVSPTARSFPWSRSSPSSSTRSLNTPRCSPAASTALRSASS
jgi:TRAP-type C4-dicarboxylate transport system substrate-binding protein